MSNVFVFISKLVSVPTGIGIALLLGFDKYQDSAVSGIADVLVLAVLLVLVGYVAGNFVGFIIGTIVKKVLGARNE